MSDAINPDHDKRLPAEAIEIIEAMIAGAPDNKAAYLHGQAAKYDLRLWRKGKSLEDFLSDWGKHIWYALRLESHLLELIEKQKSDERQKAADLQSLKDHPFGKLKTGSLNSDTIPEGYRKLNDSSEEPRHPGDLRWSIIEKGYIPISSDEIGYANRDNWAACRKVEPVVKQSLTPDPPDGWRWLEVGEKFFFGDTTVDRDGKPYLKSKISKQYCERHTCQLSKTFVRRNRFEVGEKVMHINGIHACAVVECDHEKDQYVIVYNGRKYVYESKCLAPYIEDAKPTTEVAVEVTGEVKNPLGCPDGWRWIEVGEVFRKGDTTNTIEPISEHWVGTQCVVKHVALRRNKFEVGEKVVHVDDKELIVYVVDKLRGDGAVLAYRENGIGYAISPNDLAPYIEDAK